MAKHTVALGLWLLTASFALADPSYQATLDKYCVTCHNQRLKTGGLTLDNLDLAQVPANAEVWEKVIGKLRSGTMPPAGMPGRAQPPTALLPPGSKRRSIALPCPTPADPSSTVSIVLNTPMPSATCWHWISTRPRCFLLTTRRLGSTTFRTPWACPPRYRSITSMLRENRRAGGGRSKNPARQRNLANPAGSFAG